jgi:hypothetical protein
MRDHTRAAIQHLYGSVPIRSVITHAGWRSVGGQAVYLHAGGGVAPLGPFAGAETRLEGLPRPLPAAKLAQHGALTSCLHTSPWCWRPWSTRTHSVATSARRTMAVLSSGGVRLTASWFALFAIPRCTRPSQAVAHEPECATRTRGAFESGARRYLVTTDVTRTGIHTHR